MLQGFDRVARRKIALLNGAQTRTLLTQAIMYLEIVSWRAFATKFTTEKKEEFKRVGQITIIFK